MTKTIEIHAYEYDKRQPPFTFCVIIQFFRKISLDVDYTTPELCLPEYNISSIEDEIPEGMDDRIVTIETIYADHGIELVVNKAHCSKVT